MTDEPSEEAGEYEVPRVQIVLTHALRALADLEDEDQVRARTAGRPTARPRSGYGTHERPSADVTSTCTTCSCGRDTG